MAKISFLGEGEKGFRKVAAMPSKHLENAVRHFGIIDIISTTVMKGWQFDAPLILFRLL